MNCLETEREVAAHSIRSEASDVSARAVCWRRSERSPRLTSEASEVSVHTAHSRARGEAFSRRGHAAMFVDPRRFLAGSASTASPLSEADIRATLSDAAVLATLSSPDASASAINSALAALAQKLRDSPPGLPLDAFLASGRPILDVRAPWSSGFAKPPITL